MLRLPVRTHRSRGWSPRNLIAALVLLDGGAAVGSAAGPETAAHSTFVGWTGGGCAGTGTCLVTTDNPIAVDAMFTLEPHKLAVVLAGAGTGTVASAPAGINCGADCTEVYPPGTLVTLVAVPAMGSTFVGWSGAGCSGTGTCVVSMTAPRTITATFTP